MNKPVRDAHITVTGKSGDEEVKITGHIHNICLEVEENYDDEVFSDYFASTFRLAADRSYTMSFDTNKTGYAYMFTVKKKTVTHRAQTEAEDRTTAAFEAARLRVGAPKSAKMEVLPDLSKYRGSELTIRDLDKPEPIMVEFVWKEKK